MGIDGYRSIDDLEREAEAKRRQAAALRERILAAAEDAARVLQAAGARPDMVVEIKDEYARGLFRSARTVTTTYEGWLLEVRRWTDDGYSFEESTVLTTGGRLYRGPGLFRRACVAGTRRYTADGVQTSQCNDVWDADDRMLETLDRLTAPFQPRGRFNDE